MKDQNVCNKIVVKLIQNCRSIFENSADGEICPERSTIIVVKVLSSFYKIHLFALSDEPRPLRVVSSSRSPDDLDK